MIRFKNMWKHHRIILFLLTTFLGLSSCRNIPKKGAAEGNDFVNFLLRKQVSERVESVVADPVELSLITGEESKNVRAKVSIKKGDFVYLQISLYGFEIARIMITPDSVKYINRIDKTYWFRPNREMSQVIGFSPEYIWLESVMLKGFYLEDNMGRKELKTLIYSDNNLWIYPYENKDFKVTHYFSKESLLQERMELHDRNGDLVAIAIMRYDKKFSYPQELEMKFILNPDSEVLVLKCNIGNINLEKVKEPDFSINRRYSEIRF